MIADKRLIIVRRNRCATQIVHGLKQLRLGLFLVLLTLSLFSFTRAGVYTRTHTRVEAATSSNLNFQARLMGASGAIVNDGNYSIEFNLYNVSSGGSTQWTETQSVAVKNGYLSVNLGSVTPFPGTIDWMQEQWLTMNVAGDGEMSPRLKLTAVPYAFRAAQAESLTDGSGTLVASNILQKAPVSLQSFSSANAGLRLNQTGAGGLLQLQGDGSDVFTLSKTGDIITAGSIDINGASLDIGTTSQSGVITLSDGSGNTGQFQLASLGLNRTYTFSDNSGIVLLDSTGFARDGNSFGGAAVLGTNDSNSLEFETGGTTRMSIDTSGNVRIGSGAATENLDITGALRLGTTSNTNAGTIRWTGTDFEGYDGADWVSFTDDFTGTPTININKPINETDNNVSNPGAALQPDNHLTFALAANETWTYRFVVQANSPAAADMKFSVTAPVGATCVSGVSNAEDTVTVANLACAASSGIMNTDGAANLYEVTGTVVNGANAGSVTLNWAQNTPQAANTTVYAGSYVTALRMNGTTSGLEFMNGGNSYGALAELGTNDNFGLDIITNGATRMSISNTGAVDINDTLNVDGAVTVTAGGLSLTGGLDNNSGGITEAGSITGVGTDITAAAALTLGSGGAGGLTLMSSNQSAASTDSADVNLTSGNAAGSTSNSGDVTVDAGTATGTAGLVQIGTSNASGVTLGRTGIVTTVGDTLVISGSSASIGTTSVAGALTLFDGSSNTGLFQTTALGSDRTYTLPDSSGTVCLDGNNCGFIQLAPGSVQTDGSTNPSIFVNKTGASGNLVTLQKNGTGVFTIANGGATQISATSTAAFNVSNAAGATSFFNVDTSGSIIQVGSATGDGTGVLFVLDAKTGVDPGGTDGGMYYNSTNNRLRCFEESTWKDCISDTKVAKTANQSGTVDNVTMVNDTDLHFAVAANSFYTFDANLSFSGTNTTSDFKYTITIPAGASLYVATGASTAAAATTTCNIVASAQVCNVAIPSNGYRGVLDMHGYITTAGTAGNMQFQFAIQTNSGTANENVTIYRGSSINWRKTQ